MPISLSGNENVDRAPLISFQNAKELAVVDDYIPTQAAKMHLVLGEDSPGTGQLETNIMTGNVDYYKQLVANKDVIARQRARNDVLQTMLQTDPTQVTPEMVDVVQGLSMPDLSSPDLPDIIERKYAELYTTTSAAALQNDVLDEAMESDPIGSADLLDRAQRGVFKNQIAQKTMAELAALDENRGFLDKAWDFGERLVPFVEWYQKQNAVGSGSQLVSSILPGNNLEEQYSYLWGLPPEAFREEFTKAIEEMKDRNLYVAQSWVEGFMSYGSLDSTMDSTIGVLDVVSVLPVGKLAGAMRSAVRASVKSPVKVAEIAGELGRFDVAAEGKVAEDLANKNFFNQNIRNLDELEKTIAPITNPLSVFKGKTAQTAEAINRLKMGMVERSETARRFLSDPNLIDRLTPEEFNVAVSEARSQFERTYPSVQKNVISVTPDEVDIGNVYRVNVVLGRRDGTLFESQKQAENFVKRNVKPVTDEYRIVQVGDSYQVEIPKTIDETRFLRDLEIPLDQKTPESLINTTKIGQILRSPDYMISKQQTVARGVAVHSGERLAGMFEEIVRPINNLDKKSFNELERLMIDNRASQEYFETISDFEKAFYDRFQKNASEAQIDAYFAYVQANDLDLVVRDLDWYKQKARMGLEDVTFRLGKDDINFEGKVLDRLPDGDFRLGMIEDGNLKGGKVTYSKYIPEKTRTEIADKLSQGWKLIEGSDSIKLGEKKYADLVLVKEAKRNRVGVKNVDRRAGGHKVHQYDFYVKQPKLSEEIAQGTRYYQGDTTLFNAATEKEAKAAAELFETARQKFVRGDADAMKFIRDELPITTRDWMAAIQRGDIDLSTPIRFTKKGFRTIDTQRIEGVVEAPSRQKYNVTGRYGGTRDLADIDVIRSEGNSVFQIDTAPYLSPIETLRVSSKNMLNTRIFNDLSLMTNQNFLREFGDILAVDRNTAEMSGTAYLMNPKFIPNADPVRKAAAQNVSRAFNNLMNYGTEFDRTVDAVKDKITSGIIDRLGPKGANFVSERMMPYLKSPAVFLKSLAFNLKLGLYNPAQYFIQANSLVQVASIAGVNGLKGGAVYPLFRGAMMTHSDDIIRSLGKASERAGLMRADHFEESLRMFKESGYNSVGKDVAYLDELSSPEMTSKNVNGAVKSFLKWGRTPFNEGEKIVRIAGWNAAYLEKRAAKPVGKLTRRDAADILQRAKDLGGNMTRDSNAAWQKGYAAVFSQFFGFQARITEQLLGKKLTGAERLRLFTGFATIYGVPTALGATVGVLPVRDIVLQQMSDMGIQYEETAMKPFVDGFAQSMIGYITGQDTNLPSRYGPGGLPTFYDLFRGDKEIAETLLGASGGIALQTMSDAVPFVRAMVSEFTDYEGGMYNLRSEDFLKPFRNISSVDNITKLWQVYNTGVWASRNGIDITEMSLPEGVMAAITGLQPDRIEKGFIKSQSTKAYADWQRSQQKEIAGFLRKYMRMDAGPERELMIREGKARMVAAGLSPYQMRSTWQMAASQEMITDVFFEKYDKMLQRQERANNPTGAVVDQD